MFISHSPFRKEPPKSPASLDVGLWLVSCYPLPMLFCLNGLFKDETKAVVSVLDHGFLYADGFYDTLRVYDGVLFELPLHLKRIADSAKAMEIPLPQGLPAIGNWFSETVKRNKLADARVRITITRGAQGRDFSRGRHPTVVITCERLRAGKSLLQGHSACTMRLERSLPAIKTLGLQNLILAAKEAKKKGVQEVIGIDQRGFVREGVTSNVFVVRNGRLLTPKNRILRGLTRRLVLKLARSLGIPVTIRDFKHSLIASSDEVFLTNRIREIIPIISINGKKIGSGKVGPVTKRLKNAYQQYVQSVIICD